MCVTLILVVTVLVAAAVVVIVSVVSFTTAAENQKPSLSLTEHKEVPVAKQVAINLPDFLKKNLVENIASLPTFPPRSSVNLQSVYAQMVAGLHLLVKNNTLTIVRDFNGFQSRNTNTVAMIEDVLRTHDVPDVELFISTSDDVQGVEGGTAVPILTMSRKLSQPVLTYPDHSFYNWAEAKTAGWDEQAHLLKTIAGSSPFEKKRWVTLFRGARNAERGPLIDLCEKRNDGRFDVHSTEAGFVPLAEHPSSAFLLHLPGATYSARLKYLLLCGSVVFCVTRPSGKYREFWYNFLEDEVNVHMLDNSSPNDVYQKVQKHMNRYEGPTGTQQFLLMAKRAASLHTLMPMAVVHNYWAHLMRSVAEVTR